jgi:hypothetical protein
VHDPGGYHPAVAASTETGETDATGIGWRGLVAVLVASRLVVAVAALLGEHVVTRNPLLTSGAGGPVVTSLTSWDGWWYLGIVQNGYHAAPLEGAYHDYAFLPLWPMLVKVLALPFPGWEGLIAVLLANALFVVGLVMLVRLTAPRYGVAFAFRTAALLAIFPLAAVFSMAYAESLFLVLMLGAFLAAERGRAVPAGVCLALATLTRLQGAALVIPVAWILWEVAGRPRSIRGLTPSWLALLLGPAAAVGAYLWVVWLTGDSASYAAAQGAWGRSGLGGDATGTLADALANTAALAIVFTQAVNLAVLLFAIFLFVFVRKDRIPARYVSVPVLFLGMVFLSGSIQSIGRLLMPAFPYQWILAGRRGIGGRVVWPAVSMLLLFVLSTAMFAGWFVP